MRDDGHMQGGGCHDRRRRDYTGRRRDSTDGHRECPSSRAFAIRRENGGRDFRMLPAALAAWMASAAAHQWWRWLTLMDDDPMSVTGYAIGALAVMLLPVVLVVPSLAAHGLIRPLRASLGYAVALMAVAGLLSAAAAVTADSVRWHDAAHVQARDGPADVVAVVRVRSPAVSSTVRGSDCQVDGRVVSLSIRRSPANPLSERSPVPSRADIRVLLSGDVCSALTDTAVYRFPGTLSTASYGRQPLWLTCDDMRVPDVVSAPSGTARIVKAMQQGLLRACDRLSDQARVLVPGLTVGVLGQDAVRVRDTASGAASHGSEEGLSSGTERVGGVDAAYAALLEEQFRRSGIMHLMAVSGGHFMVIAGLVHRLCSRVLAPRWATGLVMAVSDVMLAIVVFPSDSVLRALLMGLFGAAAVAAGRRGQSVSSLSWTVIIVLLIAPSMSVSYGFALSCAAVLGIVLFAGPLTDWLACMLPRLLSAPLAMTIAAQSLTHADTDPDGSATASRLGAGESARRPGRGIRHHGRTRRAVHILADAAMRIRLGLDCGMRHVRHGTRRRDGVGQRVRDHAVGRWHTGCIADGVGRIGVRHGADTGHPMVASAEIRRIRRRRPVVPSPSV